MNLWLLWLLLSIAFGIGWCACSWVTGADRDSLEVENAYLKSLLRGRAEKL